MLVLTIFLAISAVAVTVLLCFLFGVESDIRASRKRAAKAAVYVHRNVAGTRRSEPVLAPFLAYSNPNAWLQQHRVHRVFMQPKSSAKGA